MNQNYDCIVYQIFKIKIILIPNSIIFISDYKLFKNHNGKYMFVTNLQIIQNIIIR